MDRMQHVGLLFSATFLRHSRQLLHLYLAVFSSDYITYAWVARLISAGVCEYSHEEKQDASIDLGNSMQGLGQT